MIPERTIFTDSKKHRILSLGILFDIEENTGGENKGVMREEEVVNDNGQVFEEYRLLLHGNREERISGRWKRICVRYQAACGAVRLCVHACLCS